jgi:general secretion pathway protein E
VTDTAAQPLDRLELAPGVTREFLHHHGVCPLRIGADGELVVGVSENAFLEALDDLALAYGHDVATEILPAGELERAIERLAVSAERILELSNGESVHETEDAGETGAEARALALQPPVIRYVNLLVRDAYDAGASDIHLEATRGGGLTVRFRLDGVLSPAPEPPPALPQAIISRIKLLAELDTAERRRPQDGRIRVRLDDGELDLRISTVPTLHGESVVIRLLDQGGRPGDLEALGMGAAVFNEVVRLACRPHGMILVTGPTGSGKTTTLYAALSRRRTDTEKVITVEDPVEYQLPGVAQVPVHRQAGVTMGSALRSILRQDPDVIMVGEMRDRETAETAIQAAMTGHLVFSTLHTTDAIAAIPRLLDLGVADYLVAATLEGVLAQRLVRRICDACRASYSPSSEQVALLALRPVGAITLTRGVGCAACRGTGFRGRLGLFELLTVDDDLKDAITRGARRAELATLAATCGMQTLRADGWQKVSAGLTTIEEVLRVVSD